MSSERGGLPGLLALGAQFGCPLHLAGLGCVALSLATEVTGLVVGHKQKKRKREAAALSTSAQA